MLLEHARREGKDSEIAEHESSLTSDGVFVYTLRDGRVAVAACLHAVDLLLTQPPQKSLSIKPEDAKPSFFQENSNR